MSGKQEFHRALLVTLTVFIVNSAVLTGCRNMLQQTGPLPIVVTRDFFLIAWDANEPSRPELPSSVSHFNIYYRELFSKRWILLDSTEGTSRRSTTISAGELVGNGRFEIGVQQAFCNGRTSEIHGSTDFSAKPAGGWYVLLE